MPAFEILGAVGAFLLVPGALLAGIAKCVCDLRRMK